METGLLSNQDFYDEDVNVYLAHLLDSLIQPENMERARRYLSPYDTEVFRKLSQSKDARLKYTIYKTNADFLLISLGIFDSPEGVITDTVGSSGRSTTSSVRPRKRRSAAAGPITASRTPTARWSTAGPRGSPRCSEKLSVGFDKYLRILAHMRGEYLDLLKRLSSGEIYHLERVANDEQRQDSLKEKQDQFLDLYLDWKKTGEADLRTRMDEMIKEIRSLDPKFNFKMPEV